ncbi:MAG: hypothetical protein ABL962_11725 [Fimbriimonadaceae bacterium]
MIDIALVVVFQGHSFSLSLNPLNARAVSLQGQGKTWDFAPKSLGAWKVLSGDIDGNGKPDILVGVNKKTHNIKHRHKTMFVYEFDGKEVKPKWLASTLGRELVDFAAGTKRVYTVERLLKGGYAVAEYKWRGFGLYKLRDIGQGKTVQLINAHEAKIDGREVKW